MHDLTNAQKQIVDLISAKAIHKDDKGYYYLVPAKTRRSGKMRISDKTINYLKKLELWKIN